MAQYLPLLPEAELERRMHFLLSGTPWVGVTWHCWSRLLAATMVALGTTISAMCICNSLTSQ